MKQSQYLKGAIELVQERDPLNEVFGLKSKHERLKGLEKEYYDLYMAASEIHGDDELSTSDMNKLRRLTSEIGAMQKANPKLHGRVFTRTDKMLKRAKEIFAKFNDARLERKAARRQGKSDKDWEEYEASQK